MNLPEQWKNDNLPVKRRPAWESYVEDPKRVGQGLRRVFFPGITIQLDHSACQRPNIRHGLSSSWHATSWEYEHGLCRRLFRREVRVLRRVRLASLTWCQWDAEPLFQLTSHKSNYFCKSRTLRRTKPIAVIPFDRMVTLLLKVRQWATRTFM